MYGYNALMMSGAQVRFTTADKHEGEAWLADKQDSFAVVYAWRDGE